MTDHDEAVTDPAAAAPSGLVADGPPGLPGWVKALAVALVVLVAVVVGVMLLGGHGSGGLGPGRHSSAGAADAVRAMLL